MIWMLFLNCVLNKLVVWIIPGLLMLAQSQYTVHVVYGTFYTFRDQYINVTRLTQDLLHKYHDFITQVTRALLEQRARSVSRTRLNESCKTRARVVLTSLVIAVVIAYVTLRGPQYLNTPSRIVLLRQRSYARYGAYCRAVCWPSLAFSVSLR